MHSNKNMNPEDNNLSTIPTVNNEQSKKFRGKESVASKMFNQLKTRVEKFKSPQDKRAMSAVIKMAERMVNDETQVKIKRKKPYDSTRKTGFMVQKPVNQNVLAFTGREAGTEFSRTDLTKEITKYVKDNALQLPGRTSFFKLDAKLASLLNLNEGDELTFTGVQKYLKNCFQL
jgi:U3 small nucleolar RNA-associated protein 14